MPRVTRVPGIARPSAPRTSIRTTDCDWPSRGRRSGVAAMKTEVPPAEGPMSDGCVCFSRPHAEVSAAATATATNCARVRKLVLCMCLYLAPVVGECDADRCSDRHVVVLLVLAEK